jgi:hypothetical protein
MKNNKVQFLAATVFFAWGAMAFSLVFGQDNAPRLILQGGDNIDNSTVIDALPYIDSGITSEFTDDYDVECPVSGNGAPDVVYSFSPAADMTLTISLCNGTDFDSKLYVFKDGPDSVIACNDDFCPGNLPQLSGIPVSAANTYYIVVDGSNGYSGNYVMEVTAELVCPVYATYENEPDCADEYIDNTNGGCGSDPTVFGNISCGETICAKSGNYLLTGLQMRDTDWFSFTLSDSEEVTIDAIAEFPLYAIMMRQGPSGRECDELNVVSYQEIPAFEPLTMSQGLSAGNYWLWTAPSVFLGIPCGSDYLLTLSCGPRCDYIPGDANGSNTFNGLDVTYGVSYFKGGLPPSYTCECTTGHSWYVAGDVNASCSFNGLDVTYAVSYFKGGPGPSPCADCPPLTDR